MRFDGLWLSEHRHHQHAQMIQLIVTTWNFWPMSALWVATMF